MYKYVIAVCISLFGQAASAWELNEAPKRPGEWGYRPDSASPVELNPPAFTWRPETAARKYHIQVSRDAALKDSIYQAETRWTSHCPPRSLPDGEHYWRYRAMGNDGAWSNWSNVRQFTIPVDAFPTPQPGVAELRSRLPRDRPRLFMRSDQIPHLRELAEGDLQAQWRAIQSVADRLLSQPPDASEPPKYPEGMPRKTGEWKKIWWGNRVRTVAVADGAATLAFAYRITGDDRYGHAARDLLLALTEWDPNGSTSFSYNDEAAMPVLYLASRAYDWAYPLLSTSDRARVIEMQRVRGAQCFDHLTSRQHLWRPYGSHQNRAWHKLAELATTFIDDIPEAETWLEYTMTVYFTCYPVWNDSDGGWHEGLAYWNSYISRFLEWSLVMHEAYRINAFERPYFQRAGYFPMYLMPPGAAHGGFGDLTPRLRSQSMAPLVNLLASGAKNPHWKWYADEHNAAYPNTYVGFFAAAQSQNLQARSPSSLPTSTLFAGTGIAALNTSIVSAADNVQILFKSSPLGAVSHGYNSQNTFQVSVAGKPLLQNTGDRDLFGSDHHTRWMWHARSQNVILVNGEGATPDRQAAVGRVTHFRTSDAVDVVAGEAGEAYPSLHRWTRRIVFIKPGLIVIHDALHAKEAATFQFLLHAPDKFSLTAEGGAVQADHGQIEFEFLRPSGLQITQTDEYDPPPAEWSGLDLNEWHLTAATPTQTERQDFLTVYRVNGQSAEVECNEADGGYQLSIASGKDNNRLTLGDRTFEVHSGSVRWSFAD